MATDLHTLTAPVFIRALKNLAAILEKGRAFAAEKGMPEAELADARLIADMTPLTAQIQRASDSAKGCMVRIGGVENVAMEDNEVTFADMQARIAKTIDFLQSVPADALNGKESDEVILKLPDTEMTFTAQSYVLGFAIPNFYFHITTAYDILRMKGVPIGKMDYLGGV
ncbi:MAG: DUF1993 domain-containing protein [Pseudomonadota bacterium]|nr:DUF1993 domain-containing protein [Pseudomonadota bacterium]